MRAGAREVTAPELLRAAADAVMPDTFCQGSYAVLPDGLAIDDYMHPDACAWCTLGHIFRAVHVAWMRKEPLTDDARTVALEALDAAAEADGADDLPHWNDMPGRTADEVRALLLRTASALEAQAQLDEVLQ